VRGHGPTGLLGLRFYLTPRVSIRGDVGALYVVSNTDVTKDPNDLVPEEDSRFEPSIRIGISALFRNTAGPTEVTTTTVARVDTVQVPGPTRTVVDTVYRDRIAPQPAGGAGGTVVIGVVNFDFDKADLSSDARRILDDVAGSLNQGANSALRIIVTGNTDAIGGESYNNNLSQRRADAVSSYLVSKGLSEGRIERRAAGEGNPVASNNNPEGRATNRRVLIELQNQ
jgi:OOP family OmpA-OmpF porin